MQICWCGNKDLVFFNSDYSLCENCQTLVSNFDEIQELKIVTNEESNFYGKNYWLEGEVNFPDIFTRSRTDLSERNLYWLKYLLQYQLPPAQILEIGCAHASFVGLLQHIGFDAFGMEMSPWVVDYARKTFNVPMYQGPIELAELHEKKFDMIVMMDVLEHLSDPVQTLKLCSNHLSQRGQFLIQLPCFPCHLKAEQIINNKHPFEQMMLPKEHLYLFSQESIVKLFQLLGFNYVEFLPAIFSHYDMFLVVSNSPLEKKLNEEIEQTLAQTTNGQIVQALIDLRDREQNFLNLYYQKQSELKELENNFANNKELFKQILNNFKSRFFN